MLISNGWGCACVCAHNILVYVRMLHVHMQLPTLFWCCESQMCKRQKTHTNCACKKCSNTHNTMCACKIADTAMSKQKRHTHGQGMAGYWYWYGAGRGGGGGHGRQPWPLAASRPVTVLSRSKKLTWKTTLSQNICHNEWRQIFQGARRVNGHKLNRQSCLRVIERADVNGYHRWPAVVCCCRR